MNIWKATLSLLLICMLADLSIVLCQKRRNIDVGAKAPAQWSAEDCLCQCSSTSFMDKWGKTQGNKTQAPKIETSGPHNRNLGTPQ